MSQELPADALFTPEHEWLTVKGGDVTVGVTDFAQAALGDIVFVQLPDVGASVSAAAPFGEVESTKSVSDVYAPVSGEVVARNESLADTPELINSDPYGDGWLVTIRMSEPGAFDASAYLDATAYAKHTEA